MQEEKKIQKFLDSFAANDFLFIYLKCSMFFLLLQNKMKSVLENETLKLLEENSE